MVRWMPEGDFFRVTASGVCTAEEQFAAIRTPVLARRRPQTGFRLLYDGRHLAEGAASPSTHALRTYAEVIFGMGYRRFALVVDAPRVEISGRFAELCRQAGVAAQVFGALGEARRWLTEDSPARPDAA